MKKIVTSFIASIALASTLSAASVYATVNGEEITKQDIEVLLQDPRIDFDKLPQEAKTQILNGAIDRKLIAKKALKDGIEKDAQYKEAISKIKEDLALQVWQKNEIDKIKFSETEKRAFYENNKAKFDIPETYEAYHILVDNEADAKSIIKELEKASSKEEKFKELANSKSKDATNKSGGYLGKFAAEQMVPEFAASVKTLAKGAFSKSPTKSQFGYHVIYLKDKFPAKSLSYDEVKDKIEQAMISDKFNHKIGEVVKDLRKDAKIVIK